jgi:hypothetical protein
VSSAESHGTYASVSIGNRSVSAHRYVYSTLVGAIPKGLQIDHLCRVPRCVNPDHLEPVTGHVNILRSDGTSAVNARRTECSRGHSLTGSNLYVRPDGRGRQCRACQQSHSRRYAAGRAAA